MHVPTKQAVRLQPGELLVRKDDATSMILMVSFETARDIVTVKTAEKDLKYRLHERVAALPRDE
jgi:hypothetical protein